MSNKTTVILIILAALVIGGVVIATNVPRHDKDADNMPPADTSSTPATDTTPAPAATDTTVDTGTGTGVDVGVTVKPTVKSFTVNGSNFSFSPNTLTVNKGDTVTITFKNTGGTHNLVIDEFNVATPTIGGEQEATVTFVADKAGTFQYYCSVGSHRAMGMWGTLTVK